MSKNTTWSYSNQGSDRLEHNGDLTRAQAIDRGFRELDLLPGEDIEVFPLSPYMPGLWLLDVRDLLKDWSECNYTDLPEGWEDLHLYERGCLLKPEVKEKLEQALSPHWAALDKALRDCLTEITGGLWQAGKRERVSREEYEEAK